MVTRKDIEDHRNEILAIALRYGAQDIRIFGSVARGDQRDDSDLDLIVRFEPGRSLLDQGGLLMDLQDLLGVKIDVVSEKAMRPRFRENALREAVPL